MAGVSQEMLSNRHVVIALLMAPIMAVLAWFGVGWLVTDSTLKPAPPVAGSAYPLVEQSGCRYGGGVCTLKNHELELALRATSTSQLMLTANVPLEQVWAALVSDGDGAPRAAHALSDDFTAWRLDDFEAVTPGDTLRLVVVLGESQFFGEVTLAFIAPRSP